MQRLVNYQTGISGTGTYCQIPSSVTPGPPGTLFTPNGLLAVVTFQVIAGTGVSAGTVQPLILDGDGTYRAYGTAISLTAPGSNTVSLQTPVIGAALQVTVAISGGTVYLEVDAVLV